ncbi:nucleotidyltransferase family protein [bacterium]|nr:nucleotidyltransferase family protein [bacterium]
MRGILLAAGKGVRLQPLTTDTPKPLLRVGNKPILTRIIEGLRDSGVSEFAIVVGHLSEQIKDYYGTGEKLGVRITYFHQSIRNGTAGAVLPAADFLSGAPFFLGYGDILVEKNNYTKLMKLHRQNPKDSIISGWHSETPWAGGVLIKNKRDRLIGLIEKPSQGQASIALPGNLINAGLMILQPDILQHIHRVKPSSRGELELTDALLSLAKVSIMHVIELHTFWSDIGTHDKLQKADIYFSRDK